MLRTDAISDELWAVLKQVLPAERPGRRGRPWNDHRLTLEGIIWRFRTGSPWRDLPEQFGPWHSVWERHHRWSTDGTYDAMFAAVQNESEQADRELVELVAVDSTSVRAHQHAAGAPHDQHTGAQTSHKNLAAEPADHALGRSRGGWTTKIHALSDTSCSPLEFTLSAGQAGDNPALLPLIDAYRSRGHTTMHLLADKAYSHPSTRAAARTQDHPHHPRTQRSDRRP